MFKRSVLILTTLWWAGIALAQGDLVASNPDSALVDALRAIDGTPLTLNEALELAVVQAVNIHDARGALLAAQGALTKQRGAFDPELFAEASKSRQEQPSSSPFSGADVLIPKTTTGTAGARIKLPVGTEISASLIGTKAETNSSFAALNPQYNATSQLTIRQPLLQGFGPGAWGDLTQSRRAYEAAKNRYNDAVAQTRATAEAAYWDLYAAERDLAVARLTRERATALLHEAALRSQAGLVGPNETNNAKLFLAQQELSVLDAEDNLSRISDELASLIGRRPAAPNSQFHAVDEPPVDMTIEPDDSVLARALSTNPQLRASALDVQATQAQVRSAWWNALPQADLFGMLGGNGLSGTGRDIVFLSDTLHNPRKDNFGDAMDQALRRSYPSWTVGLRLTVPLLFRAKGGEHQRLKGELVRAEARYEQTRRDLEERLRAQQRELQHGHARIQSARDGVQASLDQARIGLIEFKNGKTTAFELVRLGADLADAQRRYSQALVRTAKAAARLKQLAPGN
jgi:outer membrane protein TolC